MHKWKWVVAATVLALAGLIVGLCSLARHQKHGAAPVGQDAGVLTESPALTGLDSGAPAAQREPHEALSGVEAHVPPLPATAPNDVVFGAILITFEGAQGAPSKARSKAAARELAQHVLAVAQRNFEEATKLGDPGSIANAGSIRRGILEPAIEYDLFTLEKGAVYPEPVETPRGFWVMRRIR